MHHSSAERAGDKGSGARRAPSHANPSRRFPHPILKTGRPIKGSAPSKKPAPQAAGDGSDIVDEYDRLDELLALDRALSSWFYETVKIYRTGY